MLLPQIVCPVLVGRAAELEGLTSLLDEAAQGRGTTVLIGGDAGIGKTRLCRELKRVAASHGLRAIEGRCSPASASVPYGPFMDALRFRLAQGEASAASQMLGPLAGPLAAIFPQLGSQSSVGGPAELPAERVFEVIGQAVSRLAGDGPLLLILEDFHWADPTSCNLLHFLARRITSLPLLLLVTSRNEDLPAGHPVRRQLSILVRERIAREVRLAPLARGEIVEMMTAITGEEPEPRVVEAIWRRSEGNPFFVEELLKSLPDEARGEGRGPAGAELPTTVSEAVLGRIEPLDEEAREILSLGAVIGRRVSFDLLRRASGLSEAQLLPLVEALVQNHLLVEEHGTRGEWYVFRHGLTQEVLYQAISARRRRICHGKVAAALEAAWPAGTTPPYDELAFHAREGGDHARAAEYARLAGDRAAQLCAWPDATMRFTDALAALARTPHAPAERAEILEKLAYVAGCAGQVDDSQRYAEEALALHRPFNDPRRTASLLRRLALIYAYHRGEWERAATYLREAITLLEGGTEPVQETLATVDLGRIHLARGSYAEAEEWLERGMGLAFACGDSTEEAVALAALGLLAMLRGEIDSGVARLELALALVADSPPPLERAAALFSAGIRALELARERERALTWIERALEHAAQHGTATDAAVYRTHRAALDRRAGEWKTAMLSARETVAVLRDAHRGELRDALRILGDLCRVRGELEAARHAYEEAMRLGERDAAVGLALVRLSAGEAMEAAAALEHELAERPAEEHLFALRLLPFLVEARVRAGQLELAALSLRRLAEEVKNSDFRPGPAVLAHATGLVLASQGDAPAARGAFETAAAEWRALGLPFQAVRAQTEVVLLLLGNPLEAKQAVEQARTVLAELESLGAALDAERLREAMHCAGVAPRKPRAAAGIRNLTPRECEVLGELAEGRTNREIASTLRIAEKTVGVHVSRILAKLGCATRTQAARRAITERLVRTEAPAGA